MTHRGLVEDTIRTLVDNVDGISEEISYTHVETRQIETIRGIPEKITYGELSRDDDKSYVKFHGLFLSVKPITGDSVVWNSERYHHESTTAVIGNSSYDVLMYIKKNTQGGRR